MIVLRRPLRCHDPGCLGARRRRFDGRAQSVRLRDLESNNQQGADNPVVQRLLGKTGDFGSLLGLDNKWMLNAIKAVGNYGEVFDRNGGAGSQLKLSRGLNALWSKGGLMYAIPYR